jgi:hypothetical protein
MASLDGVSTDDLRQVLAEVEGKKPTQQVMAAINYLDEGEATLEDVAERYGYTAGLIDSNGSRRAVRGGCLRRTPFRETV